MSGTPGVILFRAQPFHNGHLYMVKQALWDCKRNDSKLYIFIGSADKVGTKRNPLPIELRHKIVAMAISDNIDYEDYNNYIGGIYDLNDLSDEANNTHSWGEYLYNHVADVVNSDDFTIYYSDRPEIMLSWFDADLREHICFKFLDRHGGLSATEVRRAAMLNNPGYFRSLVPAATENYHEEIKKYIMEAK